MHHNLHVCTILHDFVRRGYVRLRCLQFSEPDSYRALMACLAIKVDVQESHAQSFAGRSNWQHRGCFSSYDVAGAQQCTLLITSKLFVYAVALCTL